MPALTPAEFWQKVEPNNGDSCRRWLGSKHPDGYGMATVRGLGQGQAHRLAWRLVYGDPGALWVLHTCDNRICVAPAHLYLGTRQENQRQMTERGRARNGVSKFTLGPVARSW